MRIVKLRNYNRIKLFDIKLAEKQSEIEIVHTRKRFSARLKTNKMHVGVYNTKISAHRLAIVGDHVPTILFAFIESIDVLNKLFTATNRL